MKQIPRIVITSEKSGKSIIASDGPATNISEHIPGLVIADIWATDTMPVDLKRGTICENTLLPITPKNGSYFRYLNIPPDAELKKYLPDEENPDPSKPHPLMHKTETLDYIVIIAGEIYMILDETETLLKTGDIVIQRKTNHAWSNRSDQTCIMLAILLDSHI
jgi:hypothetical protein